MSDRAVETGSQPETEAMEEESMCPTKKIAVVDGMVLVHKMTKKPSTVITVRPEPQFL